MRLPAHIWEVCRGEDKLCPGGVLDVLCSSVHGLMCWAGESLLHMEQRADSCVCSPWSLSRHKLRLEVKQKQRTPQDTAGSATVLMLLQGEQGSR